MDRAGQRIVTQALPSGHAQHSTTLMPPLGLQAHATKLGILSSAACENEEANRYIYQRCGKALGEKKDRLCHE